MTSETDDRQVNVGRNRGGLRRISGILLVVLGLFWFAHKAGWIPAEHGHPGIFWPVVVIAIGLAMYLRSGRRHPS